MFEEKLLDDGTTLRMSSFDYLDEGQRYILELIDETRGYKLVNRFPVGGSKERGLVKEWYQCINNTTDFYAVSYEEKVARGEEPYFLEIEAHLRKRGVF